LRNYLLILPIAFLVAYSQIVIKWRISDAAFAAVKGAGVREDLLRYLLDPVIFSGYFAALFASFAWLFVVTKLPLTVAFPLYIGITFMLVLCGGWFFLSETLTPVRILAVTLIFTGVALGVRA
jgi:multidrug transporter EmrE-like cation transporter